MTVWALLDGLLRYCCDAAAGCKNHSQADELARPQTLVLVVEARLQVDRSGRLVDHVVDQGQLAFSQLLLAVAAVGADDERSLLIVFVDVVEGFLRQGEAERDRFQLGDHDECSVVARVHNVALVNEPGSKATIDRRTDLGVAEVDFCGIDLRLVTLDRRLQLGNLGLLLIVALPRLPSGSQKLFIALEISLGTGQVRLILLFCCLRLPQRGLVRARIDLKKQVSLFDVLALLEIGLDDLPVDPAFDCNRVIGLNRADAVQEHRDVLDSDRSSGDWYRLAGGLCRRLRHVLFHPQAQKDRGRDQDKDRGSTDQTPRHPERLRGPQPIKGRTSIIDVLYESLLYSLPVVSVARRPSGVRG